ncbi:hypothetical protein [Amycolatopsis sp. NPDC021455]|uniref:hypothetical protein n=1 Tax=Amycolatopsis sp. NPDC021455 TaxID=3154901 RepID=UPI0033E653A1
MTQRGFLLWKGQGSDQAIYAARRDFDQEIGGARRVSYFATSRGIAAVVKPGDHGILTAWRGADDDSRIWTATAHFDTSSWSDQSNPADGPRTDDRPALGVVGDRVFMAWRGTGPDEMIWYSELGPGGWTPQRLAGNGTASSTHGPALAGHDGRLFLAWKGSGGNEQLYWCTYDGSSWTDPQPFAGGSTHGPALASSPGGLVMAWKGSGGDDQLWRATYGGGSWSPQQPAVGRSSHGPALGRVDNRVVMVWKGAGADERLWWSWDGFRSQQAVHDGYTTSETPAFVAVEFYSL